MSLPANLTHTRRRLDTYALTVGVSGVSLTGKDVRLYIDSLSLEITGTVNDAATVSFAPPSGLYQAAVGSYGMRVVLEPDSTTERRTLVEGLWVAT